MSLGIAELSRVKNVTSCCYESTRKIPEMGMQMGTTDKEMCRPRGSGGFLATLPSIPAKRWPACWAKLSRAYGADAFGAGFQRKRESVPAVDEAGSKHPALRAVGVAIVT